MIECTKDDISCANDANIPVDVWIQEITPEDDDAAGSEEEGYFARGFRWRLRCSIYMPRKGTVWTEGIEHVATTREELVDLVKQHVIPLYQTALAVLGDIVEGKQECLYYWEQEK